MTPDSDTYGHILLNGLLWYVVLFGVPSLVWLAKRIGRRIERNVDQRINLHVHRALHPNVRVLPDQRSAR